MDAAAITAWAKTAKATEALRAPAMQEARDRLIEQHRMRPTYYPAKIANPPGVAAVAAQLKEQIRASALPNEIAASMQSHFRTYGPTPRISDLVGERIRQQGIGVVPRISDLLAEQRSAGSLPRLDLTSGDVSPAQPLDAAPVDPEAVRTLVRQRLEELIAETVNRIARARQAGRFRVMYWLPEVRFLWVLATVYAAVCMDDPVSPVVTTSVQLSFETAGLIEKRRARRE